jgi:hypothetical protein
VALNAWPKWWRKPIRTTTSGRVIAKYRPLALPSTSPLRLSRRGARGSGADATLRTQMNLSQLPLFEPVNSLPEGFQYQPELLTEDEEGELIDRFQDLPFKEFEFHGFLGKRRVVSFGWKYDFGAGKLREPEPIPEFIVPIRQKAAAFAGIEPKAIAHVLAAIIHDVTRFLDVC